MVSGTAGETRTPISRFWRPVLCLLSFRRMDALMMLVEPAGIQPATSRVQNGRSGN